MNIYLASSWRNPYHKGMLVSLREWGHEVYDFKAPEHVPFRWDAISQSWQAWSPETYLVQLTTNPLCTAGYAQDAAAMRKADAGVLLLPCGRSAHLEAGYFVGAGKPLLIFIPERIEPELMYLMADSVHTCVDGLRVALEDIESAQKGE